MIRACLVLVMTGCAHLPSTLREPTPDEASAIEAVYEAWAHWREPVECGQLDRAMVAIVPHDELQGWCLARAAEVNGCTYGVQRYVGDEPRAAIYVSANLDPESTIRVVIHEALHQLRACWVYAAKDDWDEYARRLNTGETASCEVHYLADHSHCDSEIWRGIEWDAYARWREL